MICLLFSGRADELSEELGALLAIADSEVDNSILSKARNDPNIIGMLWLI